MVRWLPVACESSCVLGLSVLIMCYPSSSSALAEIPPVVGAWQYTAGECTNFSNASTWAADCRILDGGTWTGSNTASDPLRCETPAHPRPWPSESMIEPLVSNRANGTASLAGWQNGDASVHCVGFFDTASLTTRLGIESTNVSLINIDENAGAWGARRDRDVECPPGSQTLSDRCLQVPAPDPYRAFDMCPKNGTNPVNVFTGAKIHIETDFHGVGPSPLILKRYYSTRTRWREARWEQSGFGRYWRHHYTRSLTHFKNDTFEAVIVYRANGNRHYFHPDNADGVTVWRASEPDITDELQQIDINGTPYWEYLNSDGAREFYQLDTGQLSKIEDRNGFSLSFAYDELDRLLSVDNGFGRQLRFFYGTEDLANGLITRVALYANGSKVPGGDFRYVYEQTDPHGHEVMLDKIIYPDETPEDDSDNPFKDYLYNEAEHIYYDEEWIVDVTDGPSTRSVNLPHHLTGIVDENGDRFATYKYQRVLFSGGYRYSLPVWGGNGAPDDNGAYANEYKITRYHPNSHRADSRSHQGYAVIKDGLGTSRQFHFKHSAGLLRPTKVIGGNCEVCGSESQNTQYDEHGFVVERLDFAGNKTIFTRDEKGAEICRIEGVSSIDAMKNAPRRIVTTWNHLHRVVLERETFEPTDHADLNTCMANDHSGWVLRHRLINTYEPGSGRLAQRTLQSYNTVGVMDELPRVTTYSYYGIGEENGLPNQLKQIDGPRGDVNDVQTFRYATAISDHHNLGDLVEIENALGHITRITKHDKFGHALEVIDPNGVQTNTQYSPRGWITSRSVAGKTTRFEYDQAGQLKKTILPNGASITYDYDAAHRLTALTDNLGNAIQYVLDPLGNRVVERFQDPNGVLRKQSHRVFNGLNQFEKLIEFKTESESVVSGFAYHADGTLFREIDARDPTMSPEGALPQDPMIFAAHTYDALGRFMTSRDKESGYAQYEYDIFDQVVRVTEPGDDNPSTPQGLATSYEYNGFGELKQVTSPDTGVTRYSYDQAGNRLTWESASHRAAGVLVNYYYDALNRITFIDYPSDESDISFEYDADEVSRHGVGRLTDISDASGLTKLFYDPHGNTLRIETLRNDVLRTTHYSYDEANRIKTITTPSGETISYVFQHSSAEHSSSSLARVELHTEGSQQILVDDIQYAPFGPIVSWQYGNGVRGAKPLDLSYQVNGVSYDNFIDRQYLRDAAGNLNQINDLLTGNSSVFEYDGLSRLFAFTNNERTVSIDYDALGNRRTVSSDGAVTAYSYIPDTHHLASLSGDHVAAYTYDLDGQVSSVDNQAFDYGFDGRLMEFSNNDGNLIRYLYDAFGRRTEKAGDYTTVYYHDLQGRLLEETDMFGNSAKTYVYMDDIPVALIEAEPDPFTDEDNDGMRNGFEIHYGFDSADANDALLDDDGDGFSNLTEHDAGTDPTDANSFPVSDDGTLQQIPSMSKVAGLLVAAAIMALVLPHLNSAPAVVCVVLIFSWLIAETASAKTHYIHSDHLGTPIAMTDDSKTITWAVKYDPFGIATVHPASSAELNLRFPGQYFDKESGLHHNYFRDYDPITGRYLQSDPIGLAGGINTYAYAGSNPLIFSDPFGLIKRGRNARNVRNGEVPTRIGPFGPICGPEGTNLATWVPDFFARQCIEHDECYTCSGILQRECDVNFCKRVAEQCGKSAGGFFAACVVVAGQYCSQVVKKGEPFYIPIGDERCEGGPCEE